MENLSVTLGFMNFYKQQSSGRKHYLSDNCCL